MRAKYEDLLGVARQRAVEVGHPGAYGDLAAGWAIVLKVSRQHLAWLRGGLQMADLEVAGDAAPDARLAALARALGAGADLLAAQDAATAAAFDDVEQLAAARAEVASIALTAAVAVSDALLKKPRDNANEGFTANLRDSMTELREISEGFARGSEVGALRSLTAGSPAIATDATSWITRASVRWQQAHEPTDGASLLTRDLRSITAQVRTVSGYAWHIAGCLFHSPVRPDEHSEALKGVLFGLRSAQAGAQRSARSWQRRLSDVGGQSTLPGEVAFKDLLAALCQRLKWSGQLVTPRELITSREHFARMLDALDELTYSTHRVAELQEHATGDLIARGRLFVPLKVLVPRDPEYLHKAGGAWRHPVRPWAVTARPDCFDEVTTTLASITEHLAEASLITRKLSGSADDLRPYGGQVAARTPMPFPAGGSRRRRAVTRDDRSASPPSLPIPGR
ncbi:hypothetical protein EV644_13142 [Kribbella orskensis]|uniref:Uncharacterized protein n=1 Tax=Kribbella orskensis TaxID=2512216 RepID=A0ABY2BA60_9ACTN|nr:MULTISPECIES: hypothetical protein [Kribbella]TCN30660.1 hypothetical protein EV642_13342 [Kribbella sp. VKM Ac-2500]TCO11379.1 hypothetical protein EV644_13142 [Kribbella orskensis]